MKYDIKCNDCNLIEERQMRMTETDHLDPCSGCGSTNVAIHIGSPPTTIYKGKDWFCKTGQYGGQKKEITKEDVERHEATGAVPMF